MKGMYSLLSSIFNVSKLKNWQISICRTHKSQLSNIGICALVVVAILSLYTNSIESAVAQVSPIKVEATLQDAASSGNGTSINSTGMSLILLAIQGSSGSDRVVTFSESQNGTSYQDVMCTNVKTLSKSTTLTTSDTTLYHFSCPVAGSKKFRTPISGGATGSITITATALPNVSGGGGGSLQIAEADGTPAGFPSILKFTNGTITDNGDGSFTVVVTGGSGAPSGNANDIQINDGSGGFAPFAGTSCTNQFPRSMDLEGTFSCQSVAATDIASITSAQLATILSNESGTGLVVFNTSPTFVTPILGTPTSGVATNLTGTASGLTAGTVTTNANLSGGLTSVGNVATLQRSCQPGIGDGLNAIAAGTYPFLGCLNSFGSTWTITGIKCYSDNNGTTTIDVKNGVGTSLLTGVITCTNSFASGTQSATLTIANNDYIKLTVVADGTSKNVFAAITGTW